MKQPPSGFCTKCRQYTFSPAQYGLHCWRVYDRKRCQGTISSALNEDDWSLCPGCSGKGCEACEQSGWLLARK